MKYINFFVEYFSHPDKKRKKELDETLLYNLNLNFIKNFYVFSLNEDFYQLNEYLNKNLKDIKNLYHNVIKKRCTFQYVFDYANNVSGDSDINMLANNDIQLTYSFNKLEIKENEFFAISRWEKIHKPLNLYFPESRACISQDLWVWKGKNKIKNCDFCLGVLGCDNKIAFKAQKYGYELKNPARKYICCHNHLSNIRTSAKDISLKLGPPYKEICPD